MLSLLDLRRRIASGALTPEAAVALCRERIAERDPRIRAVVHLDADAPVGQSGPLAGIAIGVKDIVDVAGAPTRMGSPLVAGDVARVDAAVVALARRLGATPLAKTATTPFAHLDPVDTRNPRAPDRTPGGSSSGSAAAVAAGMLPLAIGTQTGGSIVRPAAFCGVAAIKPSARLLPTVGIKCFSWTLDTVGLFAASVADVAYALAALSGRPRLAPPDGDPIERAAGLRLALLDEPYAGPPEPEGAFALERAARAAERAGARLVRLRAPPALGEAFAAHAVVQGYEARLALGHEYDRHRDALPPKLRACLDEADGIDAAAYDAARATARRARGALGALFESADAILAPAAPGLPPEGLASTGDSRFNRLWTLLGDPCVAVPDLVAGEGVPLATQTISRFGRDDVALTAGAFVEAALARDG